MKALCTGSGRSREPRPSSVTISRPTQPEMGITQERAATPSISTVQAPHSPSPQPYFVRSVRDRCARRRAARCRRRSDLVDHPVDCQADRGLRHGRGSGPGGCAAKHQSNACEDTVCIQTCKPACRHRSSCPVYGHRAEAIELLFGTGFFQVRGRLTGFGSARNIVRIRTRRRRRYAVPRLPEPSAVQQFDAGPRAC